MYIYIYVYIYVHMSCYIIFYIYRRERFRDICSALMNSVENDDDEAYT